MLRATTACNFSSLIWPAGSAPAALANLLFNPPEPQIIGKTQCFAAFLPFRTPGSSFFWNFLFFDLLLFSSLTLPISAFLSVHIVGGLTSKLPSIMNTNLDNSLPARWGPLVLNFFPPPFLFLFCLLLLYTPLPARRQAASQAPDVAGPDAVGHTRIRTLSKLWMQLGTFGPEHILKKP